MTYHRRKLMDLSDVKGYAFTCKVCGACVSLPHDVKLQNDRLAKCPSCYSEWLHTESAGRVVAFEKFLDALQTLQRASERSGFNFALELAPDQERDARASSEKD